MYLTISFVRQNIFFVQIIIAINYLCIKASPTVKKTEESTSVSPETDRSHKTPDNAVPEDTPTSQHVIARVHQLLEVRYT